MLKMFESIKITDPKEFAASEEMLKYRDYYQIYKMP